MKNAPFQIFVSERGRPSCPSQVIQSLVNLLLGYVSLGYREDLLQGDGAGSPQDGMLEEHREPALKHRPAARMVQQLPYCNLIAFEFHALTSTPVYAPVTQI